MHFAMLNSKILWDSIALQYGSENNVMRIYELKHFINHSTLGNDDPMTHNTKMKGVFDELRSLRPYTTDPLELQIRANDDMVYSYLVSLGSYYDGLRNHILRSDKLPKFKQMVSMVNKEYV